MHYVNLISQTVILSTTLILLSADLILFLRVIISFRLGSSTRTVHQIPSSLHFMQFRIIFTPYSSNHKTDFNEITGCASNHSFVLLYSLYLLQVGGGGLARFTQDRSQVDHGVGCTSRTDPILWVNLIQDDYECFFFVLLLLINQSSFNQKKFN